MLYIEQFRKDILHELYYNNLYSTLDLFEMCAQNHPWTEHRRLFSGAFFVFVELNQQTSNPDQWR